MAQMWQYVIFLSLKPTKVTSDFILNELKKVVGVPPLRQGSLGCQNVRQGPLNTQFEVWCTNIAPKLKNIQNTLQKQSFFLRFFSILMIFQSLFLFGAILVQKRNNFICEKKI